MQDVGLNTPLHFAVSNHNVEGAKILLENNASPSIRDMDGKTPVQCALEREYHYIATLIENITAKNTR
jgi:ankyrin repeat protein